MADAPLSALCSICYTNPPKYRCPRCPGPVRTCSLPCYKRHQQRASCNGQRDPAAYVNKSQLATPAGIDRDYNFLTKIEHVIGKADQDREAESGPRSKANKRWNPDSAMGRYLRDNRIMVDKAPLGMSRQKANNSRWLTRSKRILWTVEWIDVDGEQRLSEIPASATIQEAYTIMLGARDKESLKRKRTSGEDTESMSAEEQTKATPTQDDVESVIPDQERQTVTIAETIPQSDETAPAKDDSEPDLLTAIEEAVTSSTSNVGSNNFEADSSSNLSDGKRALIQQRMQQEKDRQAALRSSESTTPESNPPYFYLLKPHTSSKAKVLIPLSDSATLTSCLSNRVVLEFPTIYVLMTPVTSLPEGYTTEEAYLDEQRREEIELEGLMQAAPASRRALLDGGMFPENDGEDASASQLDEKRILEMLKRDVKA